MADPELKNQELSESNAADCATESKTWEEHLRKMLPAGAPVPDEDHLDYSITVEYQGPPPCLPSSTGSSIPKPPKFTSLYKTQKSLLITQKNSKVVSRIQLDHDSFDEKSEKLYSFSTPSNSPVGSCDSKVEDEKCGEFSVVFDSNDEVDEVRSRGKVRECGRCGEGGRMIWRRERREGCIVCGREYCRNCLLKAMGSMPEGRKCVGCIGKPVDEANRERLGKCSRMLASVCNHLEVKQIMKAEKECLANRICPEQVVINGKPLREEDLAELLGCVNPPCNLRPGRYWYDKDSGLWGKEGEKPDRFISANLNVGGKLLASASNGNTKVYINGREITKLELRVLKTYISLKNLGVAKPPFLDKIKTSGCNALLSRSPHFLMALLDLKLANVECSRDTRFWVYEDGSYEEEGQNNIKGNIWGKASSRLICSLFSLPVPPGNAHGPKKDPTNFSARPVPEHLEQGKVQKLLLLGLEGSGTSTIFKQVRFIYGNKFTAQELQDIKLMIQRNIFRFLSVVLEGREYFEDEAFLEGSAHGPTTEMSSQGLLDGQKQCVYSIKQRFRSFSDWLLDVVAIGDLDTFFPAAAREYAPIVDELWKDPAIQETYKRREELQCLPDVAKFFLDRAIEISSNEYEPSEEDILYAEGVAPNNGLAIFEFSPVDHIPISETYSDSLEVHSSSTKYQLIRFSSKGWSDGYKWLEMFEGFRAVVFCVSLSDYDQVQAHDNGSLSNKMLASRDLFESLVRHPSFEDTPFVLLLNKYDAFEEKLNLVPLTVCEWFADFSPFRPHHNIQSLANQAYFYIAVKYKVLYTSITGKKLFVSQTRARDRTSVDEAFKYIREVIKWDEEARNMFLINDNDSLYSPERSFSTNIRQD